MTTDDVQEGHVNVAAYNGNLPVNLMSKRELIAAKLLAGMLSGKSLYHLEAYPRIAVLNADLLLIELQK
jgi:hypothetical protein